MAYKRKTVDLWDIEGRYSGGWETLTTETSRKNARQTLKDYRTNAPGTPYRVRKYREKLEPLPVA